MQTITLVTGNAHKLAELQKVFPASLNLTSHKLDVHEIVRHKLHQAYEQIQGPVIIEDVSAGLQKLNGLPGPFIKFFQERLGNEALYKLGGGPVIITCSMGYFDGVDEHIVDGIVKGQVVAPRGGEGFGFDYILVPDGYDKTMSELGPGIKNTISHRALAAKKMVSYLQAK
jgi:inosine triphosphate pyrophosphatase